jgi:rSAM/selenodomain-associated transferase 1
MSGAIVVFAKQPLAGRVKTRLTPPLSAQQAAELYGEMLADVLEATAGFAEELGLAPVLAVSPPEACAQMARSAPRTYAVVAQRGADLAARMAWAVAEQAAAGCDRILLRGSDSPALEGEGVEQALLALDDHDLVLCPDRDGGYNLVGLRRPAPGLFEHPMSTDRVLDDTLAAARRLGLRAHVQAPHFDIDRIEDLRLLAAVRVSGRAIPCPRTLAYLDARALWPAKRRRG